LQRCASVAFQFYCTQTTFPIGAKAIEPSIRYHQHRQNAERAQARDSTSVFKKIASSALEWRGVSVEIGRHPIHCMAAFAKWGEILEKSRATFHEEQKLYVCTILQLQLR
jgi:hypothetical protein